MDVEFLPVTYDKTNGFLQRKAESELNEDQTTLGSEIDHLKKLIHQKQVPACTEASFLTWFLRSKKHDVYRAFDQLKKYSYQRHNLMNYYGFIHFDKIRVPIENGICGVLPKRDAQGRAVLYLRACMWKPSVCSADDVLKSLQALIHFCLEYPATQISGFCFVIDNYLASLDTVHLFVKYGTVLAPTVSAFPGRFQKIAVVNSNIIIRNLFPFILALAPTKLKERTSFYGDARTVLPELFDPDILPEEFGGTSGPIASLHESWIRQLEEFVPRLLATNKYYKRKNTVRFPGSEDIWTEESPN